jgi:hypothetical protein
LIGAGGVSAVLTAWLTYLGIREKQRERGKETRMKERKLSWR